MTQPIIHLITGDSGFIGRYLAAHLLASRPGIKVFGLSHTATGPKGIEHRECDLTDSERVHRNLTDIRPDYVYHLAGTARVSQSAGMPEYYRSNVTATTFLLRSLQSLNRPVRFFLASSVHVYGNQTDIVGESSALEPIGHYGFTKYLAERAVEETVRGNPNFAAVIGRLYSCIGPGQAPGFVTSDLAHKLSLIPPDSTEPLSTGSLDAIRRFLDVRDAAPIFPSLLDKTRMGDVETYNIASPYELKIRDLVTQLVKVSGRHCRIQSEKSLHPNPFQGLRVSVDKLTRALPELKFRPLDATLRDVWESVEQ